MSLKRILVPLSAVLSLLVFCSIPALAGPVPDTGQTKCYDNNGEIPCPQPGQAFYGQDGNYLINLPSYTKLDNQGKDLPDDATSWVMVRDNLTGLVWEVKQNKDGVADYTNPHDSDNTYTWHDPYLATNGGDAGMPGDVNADSKIGLAAAVYVLRYAAWLQQ